MSNLIDLDVQVLHGHDLVVTQAKTGDRVTYRKDGHLPLLVALDPMRAHLDGARVRFLVAAWKAAHAKAQELGWLKP
jgi:hypothetical protein